MAKNKKQKEVKVDEEKKKKVKNSIRGIFWLIMLILTFSITFNATFGDVYSNTTSPITSIQAIHGFIDAPLEFKIVGMFSVLVMTIFCMWLLQIMIQYKSRFDYLWAWVSEFGKQMFYYVLIPGIVLTIALLGAIHTKFPYLSNFIPNVTMAFKNGWQIFADALIRQITTLYDLGGQRPELWIFLFVGALTVGFIMAIMKATDNLRVEDDSAQAILDDPELGSEDEDEISTKKQLIILKKFIKKHPVKAIISILSILFLLLFGFFCYYVLPNLPPLWGFP